jgi:isochorismate hydrolase
MSNIFIPGKQVEVPDIPYKDEIQLPSQETALVIADMQNDFVREKGKLTVPHAEKKMP